MRKIVIGSRESRLAIAQSNLVIEELKCCFEDMDFELLTMKTTGDKILNKKLDDIGGKGLFVKELDIALKEGRTALSVHSLKDVPMTLPDGFPILSYFKREDPRDVLIYAKGKKELDLSLPVGCSGQRREYQVKELFPECKVKNIRGNVLTRLEKLDRGEYSAIVLAYAGIKRLGMENRVSRIFSTEEMVPAAGQGILAVQGKEEMRNICLRINDVEAETAALAERAFIKALDGGCSFPAGAYCEVKEKTIRLKGYYFSIEKQKAYKQEKSVERKEDSFREQAVKLGESLADEIKKECRRW